MSEAEWLRQRVLESQRVTRLGRSEDEVDRIKRERARRFAESRQEKERESDLLTLVTFKVGEELLAVEATRTIAIVSEGRRFPLPLAPPHADTVFAFRGEPVVVVALHSLMGHGPPPCSRETRLVVVHWRKGKVGFLCEHVEGVSETRPGDIAPTDRHAWLQPDAIRGVLPGGVTLLDLEGLARQLDEASS